MRCLLGKRIRIEKSAHKFAHRARDCPCGWRTRFFVSLTWKDRSNLIPVQLFKPAQWLRCNACLPCKHGRKTRWTARKSIVLFVHVENHSCCCSVAHRFWRRNIRTAYNALRVVGTKFNREAVNHVISVRGRRRPATGNMESSARGQARDRRVRVNRSREWPDRFRTHSGPFRRRFSGRRYDQHFASKPRLERRLFCCQAHRGKITHNSRR